MVNFFPQYPARRIQELSGIWDFCFTPGADDPAQLPENLTFTEKLAVPGCFDVLPQYAGLRGTAYYRTRVRTTPNARLLLKLHGLGTWGAIFWDRQMIGIDDSPYAPMEFQFPAGANAEHELLIVIDNRFDFARQPLVRELFDFYCYGGIYRTVELHELPEIFLDRAQVSVTDLAKGEVRVKLLCRGVGEGEKIRISYCFDTEAPREIELTVSDGAAEFSGVLQDKRPWSCDAPQLHTVTIKLGSDELVERFGLRVVKAEKGRILLNGKPIKLYGFNRQESHPEFGAALPLSIIIEDLELLKDLGANFVRGSHYPQDQRFLDLCDEYGILIWEETIGWGDTVDIQQDAHFAALQKAQQKLMVKASFNHPCVILWGLLNEGQTSTPESRPLYEEMVNFLHRADPSRLVTYATKCGTGDLNLDLLDVVSFNNYAGWYPTERQPEHYRPLDDIEPTLRLFQDFCRESGLGDKPFVISETGAGGIYNWRDRFRAHWSEEYQADYLEKSCQLLLDDPHVAGFSLWVFCDFRSYTTSRAVKRPRAFNNKGVLDEYRRPKLAYDVVKKAFHDYRDGELKK